MLNARGHAPGNVEGLMSNLEELQGRILVAMDRIDTGLEGLEARRPAPPAGESPDELKRQLEEERTSRAALAAEVEALKARQAELEAELDAARDAAAAPAPAPDPGADLAETMTRLEAEIGRMRAVNARLRDNNRLLREAQGEAAADTMNEGLAAELEALRAEQSAAGAEAATVLAALTALIEQAPETPFEQEDS